MKGEDNYVVMIVHYMVFLGEEIERDMRVSIKR